ncbi:MAG: hypothetical protein IJM47_06630, partial [Synergistaceae bacterium]|nr:hypothetical protein [Synergistaceae bacterium]
MRSTPVTAIKMNNHHIDYVITDSSEYRADKYIIATGGKSYP